MIAVENLGKRYRLGRQSSERYTALRDVLADRAVASFRSLRQKISRQQLELTNGSEISRSSDTQSRNSREFWALRDVSFEVKEGEVIGIIGRNGAGKSTLLKILSRITEPTTGRVRMRGRVASLLEVGTGFHPELTGRENIFLNGAVLGMARGEIKAKFDEIVGFAEVDKFLDTPVKRYSSGMYVRLAFAVAAHLDPEILIVDEVLAVGDAAFQKKCLGKMNEVATQEGRTVIFVSHNMLAVRHICGRAIWLTDGRIRDEGNVEGVTERYLHDASIGESQIDIQSAIRELPSDPDFQLTSVILRQDKQTIKDQIVSAKPLAIEVRYRTPRRVANLRVYFDLCDENREILIRSFHDEDCDDRSLFEPGCYCSTAVVPANFLAPREYKLIIRATIHCVRYCIPRELVIPFHVSHTGRTNRAYLDESYPGRLAPFIDWQTERVQ
jgi:lipopolysaccharide transport system ATP-binding protein